MNVTILGKGEPLKNCVACHEEIKSEAALCRHCGTMQDDKRFVAKAVPPVDKKSAPLSREEGSEYDRAKAGLLNLWDNLKTERALQIAAIYTFLTIWDSLFWLRWRDPFSSSNPGVVALLGFRNFYEWSLPTLAAVFLFLAWSKSDKRFFVWAVWAGGFATLGLDLLLNISLGLNFLGLFEFGDLVDLAAAIGLVVLFFLQRSKESDEDWFAAKRP